MTITQLSAPVIDTCIPEGRCVSGLEYGAHVTMLGGHGYYVRPAGTTQWVVAQLTPASDELPLPEDGESQDEAIVRCITEDIAALDPGS